MNKRITGILIVVAAVVAGSILAVNYLNEDNLSTGVTDDANRALQSVSMHEEYSSVPENNQFVKESATATIERYKESSGVIFLGFKECPWCQEIAPLINRAAEAENVPVYYLDIKQAREDNAPEYQDLLAILTPHLPKDPSGNARISVPDISFVKDGEIFWRFEMESTTEEERAPEAYWTDERKERAIQRFRDQMKALKEE